MSLKIIVGPMSSGKTTKLVSYASEEALSNKVLYVSYRTDMIDPNDRDTVGGDGIIITCKNPSISKLHKDIDVEFVSNLNDISDSYDVYIIDEGQFYEKDDLVSSVIKLMKSGRIVYIAGLLSDYKMDSFGHIKDVIHLANDGIEHLTSRCFKCNHQAGSAWFTSRCGDNTDVISVQDEYIPTCLEHHFT